MKKSPWQCFANGQYREAGFGPSDLRALALFYKSSQIQSEEPVSIEEDSQHIESLLMLENIPRFENVEEFKIVKSALEQICDKIQAHCPIDLTKTSEVVSYLARMQNLQNSSELDVLESVPEELVKKEDNFEPVTVSSNEVYPTKKSGYSFGF